MRFTLIPIIALTMACGISPQDAADHLDSDLSHVEDWCGWKAPDPLTMDIVNVVDHSGEGLDVDKAFDHPDGFGLTGTYGCFDADATWPGGFCWAPGTLHVVTRIWQDGQPQAWYQNSTDEYGSWKNQLNARGWSITRVSSGTATMNVHTDPTTTSPGILGESLQNTWTLHTGFSQGEYWTYDKCDVKVYQKRIELNQYYAAASPTEQDHYQENTYAHEYGHCSGLAHVSATNLLMSNVYTYPGPRFSNNMNFTPNQLDMLEDFEPLN